jgi:hypothetical protein
MLIAVVRNLNQVYTSTKEPQPRRGNPDACLLRQTLIAAVADLDPKRDALNRTSRSNVARGGSRTCSNLSLYTRISEMG